MRIAIAAFLLVCVASGCRAPHWSHRSPRFVAQPAVVNDAWVSNRIDRFILRSLAANELKPAKRAEPARLIRRVHLDLVGLPPNIAEVDAFVADPSPAHLEKIVDELLASPRFGEKWATGWLDLARYADSDGYQRDGFRDVWPYRDWVIRALNADMPFDQFTVEQLAGDLLPNATDEQRIATGFHRGPTLNLEAGTDPEEDRVKQVIDRVNTTGTVWLGMSLECAQCHDHKYDPISIREYYQMYAFFNQAPIEGKRRRNANDAAMDYAGKDLELPLPDAEVIRRAAAHKRMTEVQQQFVTKVEELCEQLPEERMEQLRKDSPKAVKLIAADKRAYKDAVAIQKAAFKKGAPAKELTALVKEVAREKKAATWGGTQIDYASRVMSEIEKPRVTHVLERGDFLTPGEKVEPNTPGVLHPFPADAPRNRLGLARWLLDPKNPLTARVAVNRMWAELFGRGLVETLEDFGRQGAQPSHQELLDWMAVTFRERDGWSMKRTIRRMVLSSTYQQSAVVTVEKRNQDPDNRYYSRGPRQRLQAELIRDNALAISGLLSEKMHGPPVRPVQPANIWRVTGEVDNNYYLSKGEDLHRRGIYTIWRRSGHYPSFANFDAPNRGACTVKRESSNTPLQALTLLNDPVYVAMARAFAERIQKEGVDKNAIEQLTHAFRLAVARPPTGAELEALKKIYFVALDTDGSEKEAWFEVATALLNLHETITK